VWPVCSCRAAIWRRVLSARVWRGRCRAAASLQGVGTQVPLSSGTMVQAVNAAAARKGETAGTSSAAGKACAGGRMLYTCASSAVLARKPGSGSIYGAHHWHDEHATLACHSVGCREWAPVIHGSAVKHNLMPVNAKPTSDADPRFKRLLKRRLHAAVLAPTAPPCGPGAAAAAAQVTSTTMLY
jgi:hypothetical protein